ncbi:hypothetical protein [Amycolatopsis thailandensis]|uniref:hypothetical protein n=1 Tax=Amycolatopsis thailandensis TaxID=589330 RepID=UPI0036330A62
MSEHPTVDGIENQNVASDNAHVDQQIGVQNVGSVFHDATIYQVADGDTAERRCEVALAYLDGGLPRRAEDLFAGLIFKGHQSTERIYYYVLSVLSDRGFDDLDADMVARIREAETLCASLPADEWSHAHAVVWNLLDLIRVNGAEGAFTTVSAFGELNADRQDEIIRHLSLLVSGALDQQLEAERKHKVGTERLSRGREKRAWKFFEPDPAMPIRYQTRTSTTSAEDRWPAFVGGLVAALAFAGLFFGPMGFPFWSGLAVTMVGFAVTIRFGIEYTGTVLYVESQREAERPLDGPNDPGQVGKLVERCFREACPPYAQGWPEYTAGYRGLLRRRLHDQLRYDQDLTRALKQLKWLIDWHARRVAHQWPHHGYRTPSAPVTRGASGKGRTVGIVATVAGLALLGIAHRWQVVPIALGCWFALPGVIEIFAARRASVLLSADADVLFEEEIAEYHRRRDELSDRPDDRDMARWLALDKAHIKAEALQGGKISEQDLVSHVILTERAPFARRGAVSHGPPRYEAYLVRLVLLTRDGVRASSVSLDFTTGEIKNEDWDVFGYDRIASASLKTREKSVKRGTDDSERKVRDREFRLRLLDGKEIFTISDRVDVASETEVDHEVELDRLDAVTSGMDAALPVLEAVAHKGRAWIDFEKDRRSMWARDLPA